MAFKTELKPEKKNSKPPISIENPFTTWGFGNKVRCAFCGTLPRQPHHSTCEWQIEFEKRKRKAALELLGITEEDVARILKEKDVSP